MEDVHVHSIIMSLFHRKQFILKSILVVNTVTHCLGFNLPPATSLASVEEAENLSLYGVRWKLNVQIYQRDRLMLPYM